MLSHFKITDNCQNSWTTHVSAAAKLIKTKSADLPAPSLASFVSRFFATRDVMGRSACGQGAKFRDIDGGCSQEACVVFPKAFSTGVLTILQVDKIAGCSLELLRIIASITDLSRQMVRLSVQLGKSNLLTQFKV